MFATIQDLYIRFGRENVLSAANFDALDTTDPASIPVIESRIAYFLQQAYDLLANALRQGSYDPDGFSAPYPATLVNANSEIAFMQIYRTRHSEDETTPDAYKTIEDNNFRLVRDIQGGAVRFSSDIARAKSFPAVVRPGYAATPQKTMPPARVNGILPDRNGNIVIDEYVKAAVFDSYMNAPYLAIAGKTYVDVDTGRVGWSYVGPNGTNLFVTITGGGGGVGTDDYRNLKYKPMINGVVVSGEQIGKDLGLADLIQLPDGGTKDLFDVENELFSEIETRTREDTRIQNAMNSTLTQNYRTSVDQDTIDNGIKADKVSKSAFTHSTLNPSGHVTMWLEPVILPDSIVINFLTYQPLQGTFNPGSIALPMSDDTKAGLMTKEQAAALELFSIRLANLEAGAVGNTYVNTYADLLAIDTTASEWVNNRPVVVRADEQHEGHTTTYNYLPESTDPSKTDNGFVFGIVIQEVPYGVATTSVLGMILSSSLAGKIFVNPNGIADVSGWDALVARVTALENAKKQQLTFNTTHDHSGGSMGAITQKDFTEYATDAQAQADRSGNQALSPMQ